MPLVIVLILLCMSNITEGKLSHAYSTENKNLQECIVDIVEKYFYPYNKLTFVDLHRDSQEIVKVITSIPIISRTARFKMTAPDESYLIAAGKTSNILNDIPFLVKEASWNPKAKFLIITSNSTEDDLKNIFDMLLKYHVLDVLVLIEGVDPDLYTYNPYENYACGKRYDRIIEFGKCSTSRSKNLYPYKLVTGLKNCSLHVVVPHWPPYTIDPSKTNETNSGVEEFMFRQMSKLEDFSLTFSYNDDAEKFTMITNDMSAVGPLYMLQEREADAIMGGMVLTHPRAKAFSYVYGHLSFTEDVRYQIKKASIVPSWKNLYLEFHAVVWTVLAFTFVTYSLIFIILVKPKDKGQIVLKMFEWLFLSGRAMRGNCFTKYLWIAWVVFAYLINTYYQSSLVSLTNNPPIEYQISSEQEFESYNIKPCVSSAMRDYLFSVENISLEKNQRRGCEKLLESIETVSHSSDLYTVVLHSIYRYHVHRFFNNWGYSTIYTLNRPLSKAVYAIYFFKGFPLTERLRMHALRMRENGLIENYLHNLHWKNNRAYHFFDRPLRLQLLVPWYFLAGGYLLSTSVFFLEILIKKRSDKKIILTENNVH